MATKGPLKPSRPGLHIATKTTESKAPTLTPKWGVRAKAKSEEKTLEQKPATRPAKPQAGVNPGLSSEKTRLRMTERLIEQGIKNPIVLDAMRRTPRHRFVDEALASRAYEDTALPIGHGQTISQPYVVARAIELALQSHGLPGQKLKALELGAGCGYQAAVMAHCFARVICVERIKALFDLARSNLAPLKLSNLKLIFGDGLVAGVEEAPFDVILLSAGMQDIPDELLAQCAIGGVVVAPLGDNDQRLTVIRKISEDQVERSRLDAVRYVPVIRGTES